MPTTLPSLSHEAVAEPTTLPAPELLPSPYGLAKQIPVSAAGAKTVNGARGALRAVLQREDDRFAVVVGPCSIHDTDAALEYAERLSRLRRSFEDRLLIIMRVYLEKPRTTVGWRGLVNDPNLDGSFEMAEGLIRSRRLLAEINDMGLPAATEMLDLSVPAYLSDLISFAGIGARTTESQPHRALASGLPLPVGFKNGTDGGLQTALDALVSAGQPHSYVGIDGDGRSAIIRTPGNANCVLTLRGGKSTGPNYSETHVANAERQLRRLELAQPPALLIDCSHANSAYDPDQQRDVCLDIADQRRSGGSGDAIRGVMIESHLNPGKQRLGGSGSQRLDYGVSVTDACLGWDDTEALLGELYRKLA